MATVELPVCFDLDLAADLADVATRVEATIDAVIAQLTAAELQVERIGFLPGFPYMTGLPDALRLPRRDAPRASVPAGSVAIANGQVGVYPSASPGGWHLVGRTPLQLFDPMRVPPTLLQAGDTVRLASISRAAFDAQLSTLRTTVPPAGASTISIERPGTLTTVEDLGRPGWSTSGVAEGGVSDRDAARLANALVGNALEAAVLECTLQGPTFVSDTTLLMAVTGASVDVSLDGRSVPCHRAVTVPAGAQVRIGSCTRGARAVVAVSGGIDVPLLLGSRSTHRLARFGGFAGRSLQRGDTVPLGDPSPRARHRLQRVQLSGGVERRALSPDLLGAPVRGTAPYLLRFVAGEAWSLVENAAQQRLHDGSYQAALLADSDRMGARLDAPLALGGDAASAGRRASGAVQRGTIQLPPDGRPIILGADHQTTGGYPVLGTLIDADASTFAQLRPGDAIVLRTSSEADAVSTDVRHSAQRAIALAALHLND